MQQVSALQGHRYGGLTTYQHLTRAARISSGPLPKPDGPWAWPCSKGLSEINQRLRAYICALSSRCSIRPDHASVGAVSCMARR